MLFVGRCRFNGDGACAKRLYESLLPALVFLRIAGVLLPKPCSQEAANAEAD
jgi:hypothetical protein